MKRNSWTNRIKDENGSITIEAIAITVICIFIVLVMIMYTFLLYDKNKVSATINQATNYVWQNNIGSSSDINSYIKNELKGKLYTSSVISVSSKVVEKEKVDVEVTIKTNSKMYKLVKMLMTNEYTITFSNKGNSKDIVEEVRKK